MTFTPEKQIAELRYELKRLAIVKDRDRLHCTLCDYETVVEGAWSYADAKHHEYCILARTEPK